MRLWSLNPCYLDAKGLVALWREALLARAVLKNRTGGYSHHPQLERFRSCLRPVTSIDSYLQCIYNESVKRGYHFDAGKLGRKRRCARLNVTAGQLSYEMCHLKSKLRRRDRKCCCKIVNVVNPEPHPLFRVCAGPIEPWERPVVYQKSTGRRGRKKRGAYSHEKDGCIGIDHHGADRRRV